MSGENRLRLRKGGRRVRKFPFYSGIILLVFPLNWVRLSVLGQVPPGTGTLRVLLVTILFFTIAALLIWYGLRGIGVAPSALVPATSTPGGGGWLSNFNARRREAREQAAERAQAEERKRQSELDVARSGELTPFDPGTVVLHSGELAYSSIPAALMELKTVSFRGRSTGVSVRVARGVWLRQSGSRGTAEKRLVPVAEANETRAGLAKGEIEIVIILMPSSSATSVP